MTFNRTTLTRTVALAHLGGAAAFGTAQAQPQSLQSADRCPATQRRNTMTFQTSTNAKFSAFIAAVALTAVTLGGQLGLAQHYEAQAHMAMASRAVPAQVVRVAEAAVTAETADPALRTAQHPMLVLACSACSNAIR